MKPLIGITSNRTTDPSRQANQGLALSDQTIQHVADDYVKAIERAGGIPVIIPVYEQSGNYSKLLRSLDGLLFTGGSDIDPSYYNAKRSDKIGAVDAGRDRHELALIGEALRSTTIPVLAICRGCQLLNVAGGGTLYQDLPSEREGSANHSYAGLSPKHEAVQQVTIEKETKLHAIVGTDRLAVNSFHHQAAKTVGPQFSVTATADDGTIEGIEMKGDRFVLGVQWHPELMHDTDAAAAALFEAFVGRSAASVRAV
jgi:putative glutamine amidotransferase